MRNSLFLLMLPFLLISCNQSNEALTAHYEKVMAQAEELGDPYAARDAMFHLTILNPQDVYLFDTLSQLYFQTSEFRMSALSGEKVLKGFPQDTTIRKRVARSWELAGDYEKALKSYELALNQEKPDVEIRYRIASMYFYLGNYVRCEEIIQSVIDLPEAKTVAVSIYDQVTNISKNVPTAAAFFNLRSVIAFNMNLPDKAEFWGNKAITLSPGFSLFERNVAQIKARKQAPPQ